MFAQQCSVFVLFGSSIAMFGGRMTPMNGDRAAVLRAWTPLLWPRWRYCRKMYRTSQGYYRDRVTVGFAGTRARSKVESTGCSQRFADVTLRERYEVTPAKPYELHNAYRGARQTSHATVHTIEAVIIGISVLRFHCVLRLVTNFCPVLCHS